MIIFYKNNRSNEAKIKINLICHGTAATGAGVITFMVGITGYWE